MKRNNKALYEKIMSAVAKEVKRSLNENIQLSTKNFTDLPFTPDMPLPIVKLKELCDRNENLELDCIRARKSTRRKRKEIEYKVEIGVDCEFEFWWTIYITVNTEFAKEAELDDDLVENYDVYAFHTVEGLESEICEAYIDIDEFREQVIEVIDEAGNCPEDYEEYRAEPDEDDYDDDDY